MECVVSFVRGQRLSYLKWTNDSKTMNFGTKDSSMIGVGRERDKGSSDGQCKVTELN